MQKEVSIAAQGRATKKESRRTCFCCRQQFAKDELLRLVVDDEGQIWPDFSSKLPGRGVYLCMSVSCLRSLSDKRLGALHRDFSPQLPQWQVLQQRLSDMLGLRVKQLLTSMKQRSAIGRDAVMHRLWDKEALLVLLAKDAGDALVRQVNDGVVKREEGQRRPSSTSVLQSVLDAQSLGLALGREKVSVVVFLRNNPVEKFQQLCVWQQNLAEASECTNQRKAR